MKSMTAEELERARKNIENMWAIRDQAPVSPVIFDAVITYAEEYLKIKDSGLVEALEEIVAIFEDREEFVKRLVMHGAFAVAPIETIAKKALAALGEK